MAITGETIGLSPLTAIIEPPKSRPNAQRTEGSTEERLLNIDAESRHRSIEAALVSLRAERAGLTKARRLRGLSDNEAELLEDLEAEINRFELQLQPAPLKTRTDKTLDALEEQLRSILTAELQKRSAR